MTWALARHEGWELVLRMEDLDRERVKPGAIEESRGVLEWLGIDWDGPMTTQSEHLDRFRAAMRTLGARGALFRCDRSRKDVRQAASAPHRDEGEVRFPPELRPASSAFAFLDEHANHRLLVQPGAERVHDQLLGERDFDPGAEVGDFLIWTKLGVPSYQLAVMVDDAHQGVTDVVRGEDLLSSAARQQLLYRALGLPVPRWWHLPLVYDEGGERLAKRRGDTALASLRDMGVRRERVLGLVAHWCGFLDHPLELDSLGFRSLVTPATLRAMAARERGLDGPARPCRITADSMRWLVNTT